MGHLHGLSDNEKQEIKDTLTISNPLFFKLQNMGKKVWGVEKNLKYYEEDGDVLKVPTGASKSLPIDPKSIKIVDNRNSSKKIDIQFKGKLRPYQKDAVDAMEKCTVGTLEATTGAGKTIAAINLITRIKQPTIFLVHRKELADQFIDKVSKFTNLDKEDVGFIGSGKFELKDISVGMLQSITRYGEKKIEKMNNHFGMAVFDEVQIYKSA